MNQSMSSGNLKNDSLLLKQEHVYQNSTSKTPPTINYNNNNQQQQNFYDQNEQNIALNSALLSPRSNLLKQKYMKNMYNDSENNNRTAQQQLTSHQNYIMQQQQQQKQIFPHYSHDQQEALLNTNRPQWSQHQFLNNYINKTSTPTKVPHQSSTQQNFAFKTPPIFSNNSNKKGDEHELQNFNKKNDFYNDSISNMNRSRIDSSQISMYRKIPSHINRSNSKNDASFLLKFSDDDQSEERGDSVKNSQLKQSFNNTDSDIINNTNNNNNSYSDDDEDEYEDDDAFEDDEFDDTDDEIRGGMNSNQFSIDGKIKLNMSKQYDSNTSYMMSNGIKSQLGYNSGNESEYLMNQNSSDDSKQNRKRHKGELVCQVCGANANGYNFDAITCESCKAFFRRNAFRPRNEFRCINNETCVITINTRKKCKKCRIDKCFKVGMRKEWIMSETEREEKRRKIEENRRKKAFKMQVQIPSHNGPNEMMFSAGMNEKTLSHMQHYGINASCLQSQYSIDSNYLLNDREGMSLNQTHNNNNDKPIRRRRRRRRRGGNIMFSNYNNNMGGSVERVVSTNSSILSASQPQNQILPIQNQILSATPSPPTSFSLLSVQPNQKNQLLKSNNNDNDYDALSFNIAQKQRHLIQQNQLKQNIPINKNSDESYSSNYDSDSDSDNNAQEYDRKTKLTEEEQKLLKSIEKAYDIAILNVTFENSSTSLVSPHDVDASVNVSEIPVRRLVNFFKFNVDFLSLSQDTQTIALKGCMMELLLIHAGITYDPQINSFRDPSKTSSCHFEFNSLRNTYKEEKYQRIMNIAKKFYDLCEGNFLIIKIMFFLALFKLENDGIRQSESEKLRKLNIKYTKFLHKYMQTCFVYPRCDLKFGEFAGLMREVNSLSIEFRKIVVENSNPVNISGLMKEVFSLPENNTNNSGVSTNISATILQQQQLQKQRRQQFIEQEELEIIWQQSQEKQRRLPDFDDNLSETEIISMENMRFMNYPMKRT